MPARPAAPSAGQVATPEWLLKVAHKINELTKGHLNPWPLLTLSAGAGTTQLVDDRISVTSTILLSPTTANAAAEIGNGTLYVAETGRVNGQVTITHANNSQTDRIFRVAVIG